jgi:hypothetical protein
MGSTPEASNWTGTIDAMSSNNSGKGVLTVKIADGITVGTYNNELSDMGSNTLIDPNSQVFQAVSPLSVGSKVIFSGEFMREPTDCIAEQSITQAGSMTSPAFTIKFSQLSSLP